MAKLSPANRFKLVNHRYSELLEQAYIGGYHAAVYQLEVVNDQRTRLLVALFREGFFQKPKSPGDKATFDRVRVWSDTCLIILQGLEEGLDEAVLMLLPPPPE